MVDVAQGSQSIQLTISHYPSSAYEGSRRVYITSTSCWVQYNNARDRHKWKKMQRMSHMYTRDIL